MPSTVVVSGPDALARGVAERAAEVLAAAIAARTWAFVALPGGPLVRAVYEELILFSIPWEHVEFFFTDERCVPPDHPASNFGQAADLLLQNPRIGDHQFHRIQAELARRAEAAALYAEELPERLDLVLLEIGADGHVGALFPGSKAFEAAPGELALAVEVPAKPRWRITLAPRVIAAARDWIAFAAGREKASAVSDALQGPSDVRRFPAQLAAGGTWFLDAASAERGSFVP